MYALSDSIRQTVRDFRLESSDWEDEVCSLFDDVDRFLETDERSHSGTADTSVAEGVAGLKGLVEQQTEVLAALVNALTGQSAVAELANEGDERANELPTSEVDPFARLQLAVAAAAEAS